MSNEEDARRRAESMHKLAQTLRAERLSTLPHGPAAMEILAATLDRYLSETVVQFTPRPDGGFEVTACAKPAEPV